MKVLFITIGFPPLAVGGTETFVMGLIDALREKGIESEVAYLHSCPAIECHDFELRSYVHDRTKVYALRINREKYSLHQIMLDHALNNFIVGKFEEVQKMSKADIIHLHPLQLGFESFLIKRFSELSQRVLFTFHSSTTTCMRGDLVHLGKDVCDGVVSYQKCLSCFLQMKGMKRGAASFLSYIPTGLYSAIHPLSKVLPFRKVASLVSLPLQLSRRMEAWQRSINYSERIIAVSNWVREVSLKNGAPFQKLLLSRHGIRMFKQSRPERNINKVIRFGYLGRITWEKGISTLIEAIKKIPRDYLFEFEFSSSAFTDPDPIASTKASLEDVRALASSDDRVKIRGTAKDDELLDLLATWDALVVPSWWLESGPMVIYEAFAAGTPVIGSRRGGIAELIREGENGFQFQPQNSDELAAIMMECIRHPDKLRNLQKNIPPPRTFREVADDMIKVYTDITTRK